MILLCVQAQYVLATSSLTVVQYKWLRATKDSVAASKTGRFILKPLMYLILLAAIYLFLYSMYGNLVVARRPIDDFEWVTSSDIEVAMEYWIPHKLPLVSVLLLIIYYCRYWQVTLLSNKEWVYQLILMLVRLPLFAENLSRPA